MLYSLTLQDAIIRTTKYVILISEIYDHFNAFIVTSATARAGLVIIIIIIYDMT